MDCTETLDEAAAPESGRTMWVKNAVYKVLKQNPDFIENNEELAKSALVRGVVGMIDGMEVCKVPNSYLPEGVDWLITHKSAILAPMKLKEYKIHKDPMGVSGDVVEGRVMHDAFVLGGKEKAVCVMLNANYAINAPTIVADATNSKYTVATTTAGADIWYTLDGSDPYTATDVVKAGSNTVEITYAAAEDAKAIKAIAVPNSNKSLFRTETVELEIA